MDSAISLIRDLGFPIFVAVFLLWQQRDLKDVIRKNTEALTRFCDKADLNKGLLNE
jgi:hypothetical protein